MTPLKRAIELLKICLRPRRALLYGTIATVVLFNAIELFFPKLLQLYVDTIAGNHLSIFGISLDWLEKNTNRLFIIPLALLMLAGMRWAITYFRSVYESRLGQGALFDLRSLIFNTMQNLSFAYHDSSHSGTLISNVVEDVNYANMFFRRGFMLLVESLAYFLISFIIIFSVCPQAAIAQLGLIVVGMLLIVLYFRNGHAIYSRTKRLYADSVGIFSENMEGYLVVKGFGTEQHQKETYNTAVANLHNSQIKENIFSAALTQGMAFLTLIAIPLTIGVALYEARAGRWEFTSGRLFLLFYIQSGLRARSWGLTRALELAMRFTITAERLGQLLDSDAYLDDSGTLPIPTGKLQLDVRDVAFSYGGDSNSLQDINISVSGGSTIALVGPPGSGKTTLALLLCRFYDPVQGEIQLNNSNIRNYPIKELRNLFSLVFQDTFLFSASVRDNIAYGRPGAHFEDIVNAATIAGIHDQIMEMPQGYDTVIGERGVTLSGGQRQRISIARAILRKPRFLVLDACTSALDTKTEKAIQQSLDSLHGITRIIIAHRFSSIKFADCVYVMQNGRIVESGSPDELNRPNTIFSKVMQP